MREARTQNELVAQKIRDEDEAVVVEKLRIPGIESLHLKPYDEQAEIFTNVFKSRRGITQIRWVIGEFIEVTTEKLF